MIPLGQAIPGDPTRALRGLLAYINTTAILSLDNVMVGADLKSRGKTDQAGSSLSTWTCPSLAAPSQLTFQPLCALAAARAVFPAQPFPRLPHCPA